MNIKHFARRLSNELDKAGFPDTERDRVKAFAKVFHLPQHIAKMILKGQIPPSEELIEKIIIEFELKSDWLQDDVVIH